MSGTGGFLCRLCPRRCNVPRDGPESGESSPGFCGMSGEMRIARAALHFWEEPPISGQNGSGAVFFTGCGLRCRFCQNYEISRGEKPGRAVSPQELSEIFFSLIDQGAHNINLVTPTHFLPGIREALLWKKLPVPVVWNSSGYERPETLRALEGLVDIYLPDFKYMDKSLAEGLSSAGDYPRTALAAIREMVRQAGKPAYNDQGLMTRGVLIRHLILPGHTKNSMAVLETAAREFPGIPVSLMAQYTPWGQAREEGGIEEYPELSRGVTKRELEKVEGKLFELGIEGYVQSRKAKGEEFIPEFQ